jgi:hypothetical protein
LLIHASHTRALSRIWISFLVGQLFRLPSRFQRVGIAALAGSHAMTTVSVPRIASANEPDFAAFIAIDWADREHAWAMQVAGTTGRETGS